MSSENSWNQKQILFPPPCNPYSGAFNWKDRPASFLPYPLPRNELNMIQDFHSQSHHMLINECSTIHRSLSIAHQLPGNEPRIIPGSHPLTNRLFVNGTNIDKNSNLLHHQLPLNQISVFKTFPPPVVNKSNGTTNLPHHQLSSEGNYMIQDFHPVAHKLPASESNIYQQPLIPQLASNGIGMHWNSNSVSQAKFQPNHALSPNELRRNQVKYSEDDKQTARESMMSGNHSTDSLGMYQNPYIPSQHRVGNQGPYPLPTNFQNNGFSINQDNLVSNTLLPQNFYPQYSEKVHVCVVGPPSCGKGNLIRAFAKNDAILIPKNKPLSLVLQQGMVSFGTTLKIDVWYGEDLAEDVDDLRSLCQSSKSVIILVYNAAQKSSLATVIEWIKVLKHEIAFNVPIILIGNTTDVDVSSCSREYSEIASNIVRFSDGARLKEEFDLAAFCECSAKRVEDVEAVFLIAAFKAFARTVPKQARIW